MSKLVRIVAIAALFLLGGTATAHAAGDGAGAAGHPVATVQGVPCMAC